MTAPSAGPAGVAGRQVIVRRTLPASPERVFDLFTRGEDLARWFCDACDSDPRLGGEVHAAWIDEEGEPWDRLGHWLEFDRPFVATLEWLEAEDFEGQSADPHVLADGQPITVGAEEPAPRQRETLRIALAPHPDGCTVTVLSPLMQGRDTIRPEVLHDTVRHGWETTLQGLEQLLREEAGQ